METVRHLEIQVVGNGEWCITMGGRDCSVQMNEQKLLEVSVTQEELAEAIGHATNPAARRSLENDLRMLTEMEEEGARFEPQSASIQYQHLSASLIGIDITSWK